MNRTGGVRPSSGVAPVARTLRAPRAGVSTATFAAALWLLSASVSLAQPPIPQAPDITERSGLLMRFAPTPEFLPEDYRRDNFYQTKYANNGTVRHINWYKTQGLYGLGLKTPDTQSIYPYWYGSPGQNTVDSSSKPWPKPLRFFQGLAHPFKPVGMYYQMGTYAPIYDLDPIAPGPGPYPYPFYFNWVHGG